MQRKTHQYQKSLGEKLVIINSFQSKLREADGFKRDFLNLLKAVDTSVDAINPPLQKQLFSELIFSIEEFDYLYDSHDSMSLRSKKQKLKTYLFLTNDAPKLNEYIELIHQVISKLPGIWNYSKDLNNKVRMALDKFRRELNQREPTEKITECQVIIRSALMFLTHVDSLNKKINANNEEKLLCPITNQPIRNKDLLALSNGCYYNKKALSSYGNWHAYHPRILPGSPISIDKNDLECIQSSAKKKSLFSILGAGAITSTLLGGLFLASQFVATTSIPALVAIGGIALGTTAAIGLTIGIFITLIALPMLMAGLSAYIYLRKKYPQELAAYPALVNNEKPTPSSTGKFLVELNINQTPRVENAKKIENNEFPCPTPIIPTNDQNYTPIASFRK